MISTTQKTLNFLLLFIMPFFAHASSYSQYNDSFPSHCEPNESVYLNAKMKKVVTPKEGGYKLNPTGKVLSLCYNEGDSDTPMIAYRYGIIGDVEFEKVATPKKPFHSYRYSDGKFGDQVVFFSNGNINYYVSRALGMASGISINVFRSGKKLVSLFSGTDSEFDYNAYVYISSLPREVLTEKTPRDAEMRSPNRINWIRKEYKSIRDDYKEYKKIKKYFHEKSTEGVIATAYQSKWTNTIQLIEVTYFGEIGKVSYEIYYQDEKAFFIFEKNYSYNAPITMTAESVENLKKEEGINYQVHDGNKSVLEEWRYYFDGDYIVKVLDPDKKVNMDFGRANTVLEISRSSLKEFTSK